MVYEGQGVWPSDGEQAWVWWLPTDAIATTLHAEFGPISGLTLAGLLDLFDETTQDAMVVTWWQNADGECFAAQGPYWNNLVDCLCMSFWLHQDWWPGGMLPAQSHTTQVWVMNDQGSDTYPEMIMTDTIITTREIPTP